MKRLISIVCTLALCAGFVSSCSWSLDPQKDTQIPEGVLFYTNANLEFYFLDGEGNDLVDLDDVDTYPVSYPERVTLDIFREATGKIDAATINNKTYSVYTSGHNWLTFDETEKHVSFGTHYWGKTVKTGYTEYLYVNGSLDSLTVSYQYLTSADDVRIEGGSWAVKVQSIRYNGQEIFTNNESGKVFIEKPSRDQTIVRVGE